MELCVFCRKYEVDKLSTKCMDDLFTHMDEPGRQLSSKEMVQYVFDHLDPEDALCRWIVTVQCSWCDWDHTDASGWSLKFLTSVLQTYARMVKYGEDSDNLLICDYHDCKESKNCSGS